MGGGKECTRADRENKTKTEKKTEKDTNKHPAAQTRLQDRQTNKTERINK